MRCIACGAEMLLVKVVPEHTMMVPRYERYTLQCLGCYELVDQLVFNRQRLLRLAEPALSLSVLTLACVEADRDLDESEALLKRAMEMVRAPTRSSSRNGVDLQYHFRVTRSERWAVPPQPSSNETP